MRFLKIFFIFGGFFPFLRDKRAKKQYNRGMKKAIYFDHAATTPLNTQAFEKMRPYFLEGYGNADSPHALGRVAAGAVDEARDALAASLGAKPSEIYFTSGGTEADNWAILGGARAAKKRGRTHILISAIEHHAALFAAETLALEGFTVETLPVTKEGVVEESEVAARLRGDTALVCVMAVNNETGVRQPVREIAALCKKAGALCFVDGVQAYPHEKINVKDLGVDMLSVSSHKICGPKGVGALYIKSGVKIEKLVGGGEQERGLRGGTLNVPAIVGFGEAVKVLEDTREAREERIRAVKERFLQGLSGLEFTVNGDESKKIPAIVNLRFHGVPNATLLYRADLAGVMLAAGSACASASVKPSHVLTAMGFSESEAKECVRVSFGESNTLQEAEEGAKVLKEIVLELRKN